MALLPHTTRAPGTILTAAIYNADHQKHVANAEDLQFRLEELGALSGISIDDIGPFADRDDHDNAAEGFIYLSTDGDGGAITTAVIFRKQSATPADWSDPAPLGAGNVVSTDVFSIMKVTQVEYDAIPTPDANTLYLVVD